jgi:transposase
VVSIDEKSQIQALDRTAPLLPLRPGMPAQQTHDYRRHGTTTLFAALTIATGQVTDRCYDRHTHTEFLDFLKLVAKTHPRVALHVVCDNYAHKHPQVKAWLARNPRVTMHFTPTSGSWLNMVEIFFGIITRQAIRRGTFTSVKDLIGAIEAFIDGWNERSNPSSGPAPPTRSSARSTAKELRPRDTSSDVYYDLEREVLLFGARSVGA